MLPLAEIQRRFARAVLLGEAADVGIESGIPVEAAFAIHRDTVVAGLVNALRLTFPTVDALVGERFFDSAGQQFAVSNPPRRADLDRFGYAFIAFLRDLPQATGLPYLADVASLDWAIGQVLRQPDGRRSHAIDPQVSLSLPQSLSVLRLSYPAHAIRAAIGDAEALATLNIAPADYRVMLWRKGDAAAVLPVRLEAGDFLQALIDGADIESAMQAAGPDPAVTATAIQNDVFAASFCQIHTHTKEIS